MTPNEQMRYSSPVVTQASAFAGWVFGRPSPGRPPTPVQGALASARILLRAPRLSVELTDSPSGDLIRRYLNIRRRGVRSHLYAQGVLTLPASPAPLLQGRRFQAARTNVSRALREGIACRGLPESDRPRALAELSESVSLLERRIDRWWVAEQPDGRAVGLALVTVDEQWAMLNVLAATGYAARYLLHTHVVSELRAVGSRYLFAEGPNALTLPPGLQYLQARLGYEIANLRLGSRRHARDPNADTVSPERAAPTRA